MRKSSWPRPRRGSRGRAEGAQGGTHELPKQQMRRLGAMRDGLAAQLGGGVGPVAQQLRELAAAQRAAALRRRKHTPLAQRRVAPESEWWDCLLDSLGLAEVGVTVA